METTEAKLCSSDEKRGMKKHENGSKNSVHMMKKRGMENMKMESQLCSSASSCKLLGNLYGGKN